MQDLIFVHGMFQNAKSWDKWVEFFSARGYRCSAPSWPLHEGEPSSLRENPPRGLGELSLDAVIAVIEYETRLLHNPVMIGHSVGGLITQILLNRGLIAAGVAIAPVAPNAMLEFDWDFFRNSAKITNPLKGDQPFMMDRESFRKVFANTLSEDSAAIAFDAFATHDSRNILRDCMGPAGRIDLDETNRPLLLIGAENDRIIPADLVKKNAQAYGETDGGIGYKEFAGRSHFICGEPGWEDVADYAETWLSQLAFGGMAGTSPLQPGIPAF